MYDVALHKMSSVTEIWGFNSQPQSVTLGYGGGGDYLTEQKNSGQKFSSKNSTFGAKNVKKIFILGEI